jgi:hypothetical protein
MASLGSHENVWETCLQILHRRGWRLQRWLSPDEDGDDTYAAVLGGIDLAADNPIELLGLAAIHDAIKPEKHEPYWWCIDAPKGERSVSERLLEEALARQEARVEALTTLRRADPDAWSEELRVVLENSGSASDAAMQLGVPTAELRRLLGDPLLAPSLSRRGWS